MPDLNKLAQINRIANVNSGGCLVVAYAMYKYLTKLCGIDPNELELGVYDNSQFRIKRFEEDHMTDNPTANDHYAIIYKGVAYDSGGELLNEECGYTFRFVINGSGTFEYLVPRLINKSRDWNTRFNRAAGINKLEEILDINLSEISRY